MVGVAIGFSLMDVRRPGVIHVHVRLSALRAASILSTLALAILTTTGCQQPRTTSTPPVSAPSEPSTLEADVAHLKDITPAQSHTMIDVGYHMSNLWFAAQQNHWDLAAFEVDETRNRIRWTIRISPTRPMIPTTPPQTIINYDPNARWPQ